MRKLVYAFAFAINVFNTLPLYSQDLKTDSTHYNPQDYFLSPFNPPGANVYRSTKGIPGPQYWQNTSDYIIHATLNEQDTSISGDVKINYTNNSPDKLEYLWLQLDQNLFNPSSRGLAVTAINGDRFDGDGNNHGGYKIASVVITYKGKSYQTEPVITDTRMQLRLREPMQAKGDKISINIHYSFDIPQHGCDRFGRLYTKNGVIYEIAQWYPRMCVYDDVEGWNTLPYLGLGEFYCDYGNYDYYVTAPANMIVWGSGDLQNSAEVLTATQIKRINEAYKSDKTVTIIGADELGKVSTRPASKGNLTWHYTMKNTRDVAWAASSALIWDAARIKLPSGKKAIAMSAYPIESMGDTAWSRATEYLKNSIEIYSKHFYEFPWNKAVSIAGIVSGMEYPGITFDDYARTKAKLWFLIAHEIGHNWFPMIVGSNERRYMWQDEGFNSFINYYATDIFNNGEYAKDSSLFTKDHFAYFDKSQVASRKYPMMTLTDAMDPDEHYEFYAKTAYGLKLLREFVLGKDRFDYAFKKYIDAWAYKHPTPYDFFNTMNNAGGEDLNWFWKGWFFTNNTIDQAISGVTYIENNPSKGALITIANKGKMIMPVRLEITEESGKITKADLPVEIWYHNSSWTFSVYTSSKIKSVMIDPENLLPDINVNNNRWLSSSK